jgi:pimeloyl-ACP methyl ester carboxylesterase
MLRTRTRRCLALAGLLAVLVLSSLSLGSAQARVSEAAAKPSVVLVHGAWADASSWKRVTQCLQKRGYTVYAPPNPLRGLHEDAAYIADFVSSIPGPVVLVGHSYGGAAITDAATSTPNVTALVYADAFAPAEGESVFQLVAEQPGSMLGGDPATVFDFRPYPGAIIVARAGAGSHTVEVAASHLSMLSQSGAVARLIVQAAHGGS